MSVKRTRRIALVGCTIALIAGAALALVAGSVGGMKGDELRHMALLLVPAILATMIVSLMADRLLAKRSLRSRFMAVALLGVLVSLLNLGVLVLLMSVSHHDATLIAITLLFALAAGVGAASVVASVSAASLDRVADVARRLGENDLSARVGPIDAGKELATLSETLDEMADRLQRSIERERTVEAQRRDLVTAVSHDLRTPLANLRAMVEAIDDGVVEDVPTLRRYAEEMRGAVESLKLLTDDLFELVQLDAGAIAAETKRSSIDEVMESALAACRHEATSKGLTLESYFDGASGCSCSPRLVRVLQNLVQNAIRHTPADGTVRIEARRDGDDVCLTVEDTGEGIAPESLERVFEPFWRGDQARSTPGSGLGLALAKRIVEATGGTISAQSGPKGARFAVVLPVQDV